MGADLFIKRITDVTSEKYRPEYREICNKLQSMEPGPERDALYEESERIYKLMYPRDGYFRAAYNKASFASRIGLSWWNYVTPMLDREGCLRTKQIRELLQFVKDREIEPTTTEELESANCKVDDGEDSPEAWFKSWIEHRDHFVEFLEGALANGDKIHCSL